MQNNKRDRHLPVLLEEVINGLAIRSGNKYIDATVGDAGHALEIIKKGGLLLGIDRDPKAVVRARQRLKEACPASYKKIGSFNNLTENFQPIICQGNFANLKSVALKYGFNNCQGVLFDLGVSSHQLQSLTKGLSFSQNVPLDMRLDPNSKISAKELVNTLSEKELYGIFTRNAQEELARSISKAIISTRSLKPIKTTGELVAIVRKVKSRTKKSKIHPATKVFLALRIEVNNEIENLKKGISQAVDLLETNGRLAIISFHETEDRLVKLSFRKKEGIIELVEKKPIIPSNYEINNNPRSRSAKLRIIKKL